MVVMCSGYMIAFSIVAVIATGLALYSLFEGDDKAPPPPPHRPPPPRRRRRSSSRSSGFESSPSKANSVYSDSPKVKSDSGLGSQGHVDSLSRYFSVPNSKSRSSGSDAGLDGNGSRRPGSVDSNTTKSSSRSGSSSSKSKSRSPTGSSDSRLDKNSTKSSSRSGSSSSKSKSRSGSVASSSSISKCESWSITSERHLGENGVPLCLRSDSCITCGDEESGVVTFFPCGGSYLCRKCAFKFLDIGNFCCKCGLEIENVFLKNY